MNINIEALEQIPQIFEMMKKMSEQFENKIDKRWLNISEAAYYLGYSKDHLHKLKDSSFILGQHYFKRSGRLLFDKNELDRWVMTTPINNIDAKGLAEAVLKDVI
ncbi:MAG: helix-turn-helix domain-containing protein [Campylobacterota bacterium]|nr:helix-turn-helix domain-containing protein [Campylobacterota bacterium]